MDLISSAVTTTLLAAPEGSGRADAIGIIQIIAADHVARARPESLVVAVASCPGG